MPPDQSASDDAEYETLVQFLYRTPVGLIDAGSDGAVHLMTPMAAQLLMPLAPRRDLSNLFDALQGVLPQLRALVDALQPGRGAVCEALRFNAATRGPPPAPPAVLSLSLYRADDGRLTGVLYDATREERRQRRRLDVAASTDSLTGLANRSAVHENLGHRVTRAFSSGRRLAVLFINCDRFQHINDTAGHAAGDALLRQVAGRLLHVAQASPMGPADTVPAPLEWQPTTLLSPAPAPMVGRVGGDEFVVVAELDEAAQSVGDLANRIAAALGRPYALGGRSMLCPVSIGVAFVQHVGETPGESLYNARLAMAEAKREGGGHAKLFDGLMLERAKRRTRLENDLRRAVATQALYVVYQPVVLLQNNAVEAVEALVRWQHPELGAISPVEFIGIAEECGLIAELGTFVLQRACHQFAAWRRRYPDNGPRLLAVNLSRGQLPQPTLASDIQALLQASGLAASELQLEVTESLAAQDEAVQTRLHGLKRLGLTLALDDFGTGYSSLASLHQLPMDVVKIDRSFVSQIETSEHHRVLVEATIKVAKSLRLRTVAEGIETPGQAQILSAMQCDKGQGYFFARPLEVAAFEAWLERRTPHSV